MSEKSAKASRRIIRGFTFPAMNYQAINEESFLPPIISPTGRIIRKVKHFPEKTHTVEVNHPRRIRRLASSSGITLPNAIRMYQAKIQKKTKPGSK